ncbi:MAG: GNAT family N-acetyltransferase [Sandaracinaceae bacterium]
MFHPEIVPASTTHWSAIESIAIATGLFAAEEVGAIRPMFDGGVDGSMPGHTWLVAKDLEAVLGAAYVAPEPFADRVWNLYFLGVSPDAQGKGVGRALVTEVERRLRELGDSEARVLIIETSSGEGFDATRVFYAGLGYDEEARIRDYYGPGEAKVVFWKALTV